MSENAKIIEFKKIGKSSEGYLSISESGRDISFEVKRVFWTYYTPEDIVRGRHAHIETEMVLVAVSGRIIVNTEMPGAKLETFVLDRPDIGLYMPKLCWHTMQYSHNAVQLVMVSTFYNESDYIRDYRDFKKL